MPSRHSKPEEVVMAGDGGRVPDVSEQRAEAEAEIVALRTARSPQGEDHEAPEFDEQAITDILVAIDDVLEGYGRQRMDMIDGPTVDAVRDAVKRELVAFVARSDPSRDGTVAVEDVRAFVDFCAHGMVTDQTPADEFAQAVRWRARRLLAEFGSARAGESNEGGNQ